ncbi:hypothetical protein F4818DRAFT_49925 [Hypoxylon cercidicola]|nr:hypothetical protein F4818DRAFT_49925 [Hypoxylon cercidicola]
MASIPQIPDQETVNRDDQVQKRLFIFCDGTWQDGVNNKRPLTNVATLARCLEGVSDDNYLQIVYYDNGVGNATTVPARVIDGATGRGISVKIKNAYSFLSHNYNFTPTEDDKTDEIYLIGFSRGAFAVQCLASFISQTGLFKRQHLYYLRGLFTLWKHQGFRRIGGGERSLVGKKLDYYVENFRSHGLLHRVRIKACVVWDTVSALGFPTPWPRPLAFVGKEIPEAVENAFQVLALDESRAQFKPCIWDSKEQESTHAKQCWFLGSHADVGGNGDPVLGAIALVWTIGQLQASTKAKFNETEVVKHLKHRFLEWDFRINEFFGQIKETAVLSDMPNSGRITKPSWYWWLSGLKLRGDYLRTHGQDHDLRLVHFTVRFAMAERRNKSKPLRLWTTETQDDDTVQWRLRNSVLFEDKLSDSSECCGYKEYKIFEAWRSEPPPKQTDRGAFAEDAEALIQDNRDRNQNPFISFLVRNLKFEDNRLAQDAMYPPRPPTS